MKIKTDFVTNSSSVAYIVMLPNNFSPNENEIRKEYDYRDVHDDCGEFVPTFERAVEEVHECIDILKKGENIWNYGHDGVNPTVFYVVMEICDTHDFILTSIDISCEGNNIIQGVTEGTIERIVTDNIDILSIFKLIQRGNEIDTSKIEQS